MEYLYGRNPVFESLRARRRKPIRLFLSDCAELRAQVIIAITSLAQKKNIPVSTVPKFQLERLVGSSQHQGVVLQVSGYPYVKIEDILTLALQKKEDPFVLILDLLQDPQNVGTLLRTAEAVGVHGIILQERRAVGITPAVVNSSAGAVEHLYISQVINISQAINFLKKSELWIYGLEHEKNSIAFSEMDFSGPIGLVVGSEGEGIRELVRRNCDHLISIPMKGQITSLNAAVAGSIALYQIFAERNSKEEKTIS